MVQKSSRNAQLRILLLAFLLLSSAVISFPGLAGFGNLGVSGSQNMAFLTPIGVASAPSDGTSSGTVSTGILGATMSYSSPTPLVTTTTSIWTDQSDYAPGSTITINGTGFTAYATVTVSLTQPNGTVNTWQVTSDGAGNFTTTFVLDDLGGTYYVSAIDGVNTATTTFTDSGIKFSSVAASDSTGTVKSTFLSTESVYAKIVVGNGGLSTVSGDLYVNKSSTCANDKPLTDVTGTVESVTYSSTGTYLKDVWDSPLSPGTYVIAIETGGTSQYDSGADYCSAPFTVSSASSVSFNAMPINGASDVSSGTNVLSVTIGGSGSSCAGGTQTTITKTQLTYTVSNVASGTDICFAYYSNVASTTTGKQYAWSSTTGTGSASSITTRTGSFTLLSTTTVTANYDAQYQITFDAPLIKNALDVAVTDNVLTVTVGGTGPTCTGGSSTTVHQSDLAYTTGYITSGTNVCYSYNSPIASTTTGKQYAFSSISGTGSAASVSGQSGSFTLSGVSTVTAIYVAQYEITFDASPIDGASDVSGTTNVLSVTVDGTGTSCTGGTETIVTQADFPYTTAYIASGTNICYSYDSPIASTTTGKQYSWSSTSSTGITPALTAQSGSFTLSGVSTVTATYVAQYQISFDASPINGASDVSGTTDVLTVKVGGSDTSCTGVTSTTVTASQLKYTTSYITSGTYVCYSYDSPIASTTSGKQYVWSFTSGTGSASSVNTQSGYFTVTDVSSVTATYTVQFQLTVSVYPHEIDVGNVMRSPSGSDCSSSPPIYTVSCWYDSGTSVTLTSANNVVVSSTLYIFSGWSGDLTGTTNPNSITMNAAHSVTANYVGYESGTGLVTDQSGCGFTVDSSNPNAFRLVFTSDPANPSSYFEVTATNPGQFGYNIFAVGTSGDSVSLTIKIPYPFVTQGSNPIQIYSAVSLTSSDCFVPSNQISATSISVPSGITTPNGGSGIGLTTYGTNPSLPTDTTTGSYTTVTITGTIPSSGLFYVEIHLDYGLKPTSSAYFGGYTQSAFCGSSSNLDAVSSPSSSPSSPICNLGEYEFSDTGTVSGTPISDSQTIVNENDFKHDPGIAGLVLDLNGTPIQGAHVTVTGPNGFTYTTTTDQDGYFSSQFKFTGKAASFTVTVDYETFTQSQTVILKANHFEFLTFILPIYLQ